MLTWETNKKPDLSVFTKKPSTEYYEPYALIPLAEQVLKQYPAPKKEFEKRLQDNAFTEDPRVWIEFFYVRGPYFDQAYRKYPVLMEY